MVDDDGCDEKIRVNVRDAVFICCSSVNLWNRRKCNHTITPSVATLVGEDGLAWWLVLHVCLRDQQADRSFIGRHI